MNLANLAPSKLHNIDVSFPASILIAMHPLPSQSASNGTLSNSRSGLMCPTVDDSDDEDEDKSLCPFSSTL